MLPRPTIFLAALAAFLIAGSADAQWTNQTITLQPGWNAVFLEIQPQPGDCDAIFAGIPLETVWSWNRRFTPIEYITITSTNLNNSVPRQPDWLVYYPPDSPLRGQSTLISVTGGKPLLLRLAGNTPVTWTIVGKVLVAKPAWVPNSMNLVGFTLPTASPPSYRAFFAASAAHSNSPIYTLNSAGSWVITPATSLMQSGRCFWIFAKGYSDYAGPTSITLPQYTGLNFGRNLAEQVLRIKNATTTSRTYTLAPKPSLTPAVGQDLLAGEVPMQCWSYDALLYNNWLPFPASFTIAAGQQLSLRVAIVRTNMAAFTPPPGITNVSYQSILEVTDDAGLTRIPVPVTALGLQNFGAGGVTHAGLWVGTVSLNAVNQPTSLADPSTPLATGNDFQFRIILHLDRNNTPRLLQKVVQMWQPGTYKPDPANGNQQVVDSPGRFVLLTDDSLIPNYSGASLRDGQPVGRRFSSVAFSFKDPVILSASGAFGSGSFSCIITNDYDAPLNPFKHKFHPDHDNRDQALQKLPEGVEGFTVTRTITLQFSSVDPQNLGLSGWGDTRLGGTYTERITGLHRNTLAASGTFMVQQASSVAVLNDGN